MKILSCVSVLVLLSACGASSEPVKAEQAESPPAARVALPALTQADRLMFVDAKPDTNTFTEPPVLRAQVMLDRAGFSPGVIDGKEGQSFSAALRGFQIANELTDTGKLDDETLAALEATGTMPATRLVIIPSAFANGPFVPMPDEAEDQAKLDALTYSDMMEALAERFHTTPQALVAMNAPGTRIGAGKIIRVPNIAEVTPPEPKKDDRGWGITLQSLSVSSEQPEAVRVIVDKSESVLKAYDANDKLIAQFPATMGSSRDPLPIGTWKIQGVSRNPDFHYNPKLFWDVSDDKKAQMLPPGPNGPVGVVWIDLSKPHYGIHGTNAPHTIGRAESHGCVRLTNWDAARLAQMVKPGVQAVFQE